jgi:hypothetical protein
MSREALIYVRDKYQEFELVPKSGILEQPQPGTAINN